MKSKIVTTMSLALTLVLLGALSAGANVPVPDSTKAELSWTAPINSDVVNKNTTYASVLFTGGVTPESVPWLGRMDRPIGFDGFCRELDAECLSSEDILATGLGLFQLCSVSPVAPCVESLDFQDQSLTWQHAKFLKVEDLTPTPERIATAGQTNIYNQSIVAVQKKWGWKSDPKFNIPGSANGPLIFELPGKINSAGSETYALQAKFEFDATAPGGKPEITERDFNIALRPVFEVSCSNPSQPVRVITKDKISGARGLGGFGGACIDPGAAAYVSSNHAGWAARYVDNLPIRLSVRLPASLGGWFQGRIDTPDIQISKYDQTANRVVFTGSPIETPITSAQLDIDDPSAKTVIDAYWPGGYDHIKDMKANGMFGPTGPIWTPAVGTKYFDAWGSVLNPKARGSASIWQISNFKGPSGCLGNNGELQGMVTTNAMVYQAKTPAFENGFLNYKVAGVHLNSQGDVFRGTYNFIMRSSVARCLYGFSSAPIGGTVSVVASDGQQEVATTSVTEKDGWIKLSALNFTFSSPTIKAKLSQAPTKITIKCTKGKNVKRITAVAPKCPVGYKRL